MPGFSAFLLRKLLVARNGECGGLSTPWAENVKR